MSSDIESLKKERERFVAFAFAAAEIFFEIDRKGGIHFKGGAYEKLLHHPTGSDKNALFDSVVAEDKDVLLATIELLDHKGRIGPMPIRFYLEDGRSIALRMFALKMPDNNGKIFLSLRSAPLSGGEEDQVIDPATGLLTKDNFLSLAAKAMKDKSSQIYMSAVDISGIEETEKQFGRKKSDHLLKRIAVYLKTLSLEGNSASKIGDNQFAFLHRSKNDGQSLEKILPSLKTEIPLSAIIKTISPATNSKNNASETQVLQTISYILQKFTIDTDIDDISSMSGAYDTIAKETLHKLNQFRSMIETGNFKMAFQPVVRIDDQSVDHNEILSRFTFDNEEKNTRDMIKFAEDIGIIRDFDIALTKKAIDYVRKMRKLGSPISVSLNISAHSLDGGDLTDTLVSTLKKGKDIAHSIILELTETSIIRDLIEAEKILSDLKSVGYRICLGGFGAGGSGYQYLKALGVDLVKIDGIYVRDMNQPDYQHTFLLSMVRLCGGLGIKTIAQHVENRFQADFLQSLGVTYGQGYYYGEPTPSPQSHN